MKQARRVSQRIPYEESVCLTRVDGGGRLFGRSVDLGATGIYVTCLEPCEIGTELVCSVLLPGGPRKLLGRVIRLTALARGVGIAIAFHDLGAHDQAAISRLISDHEREVFAAKLRIVGVERPVRCEAVFDADIVHLTTTLPFLRLDADVGLVLGEDEEVEAAGVISKIALDPAHGDGVPRLALDVQLGRPANDDTTGDAPPTALPALCHAGPTVVVSKTLEREAAARAPLPGRPRAARRPHGTAEIARPRFMHWTPPPAVRPASQDPGDRTERTRVRTHALWRWPLFLVFVPVVAALAVLLARSAT
jgi:PilZ domain